MVGAPSEAAWGELAKVYVSSMVADLTGERRAVLDWLRLARRQAVDSYLPDSDSIPTVTAFCGRADIGFRRAGCIGRPA